MYFKKGRTNVVILILLSYIVFLAVSTNVFASPININDETNNELKLEEDFTSLPAEINVLLETLLKDKSFSVPEWIIPGLRVYYSVGIKNIDTNVLDSSSPLIRLDNMEESGPIILRNDITSVSTNSVSTFSTIFVGDRLIPWEESSTKTSVYAGPFWLNSNLIDIISNTLATIKIEHIGFDINSNFFDAVKIDYKDNSDSNSKYYTWIFDKNTGLMLYLSKASKNEATDKFEVSIAEFLDMRYLQIPWAGSALPSYFKKGSTFNYNGSINNWVPTNGINPPALAVLVATVEEFENEWANLTMNRAISSDEFIYSGSVIWGSSTLTGGFWIPSDHLKKMNIGDTLDDFDSITMSSVKVSKIETTSDMSDTIVTITEYGKNYNRDWSYRVSDGLLVSWNMYRIVDPIKGSIQQVNWQLNSSEIKK